MDIDFKSLCRMWIFFLSYTHGNFVFLAFFVLEVGSRSRSEIDAKTILYFGMTFWRYPYMPRSTIMSSTVIDRDS